MATQVRTGVEDGFIRPPTHVELIVSDHCNISCRQCNHASPRVAKWNVDPAAAARDLARLARVLHARELRLIGGEPLLHPRLTEVVAAARASGISPYLKLVTNGTLIDRLAPEAWRQLDCVEISRYPGSSLSDAQIELARARGAEYRTEVVVAGYDSFRDTFTARPTTDDELVGRIFRACKIANLWKCPAIYRGHVYRCPQSIYAPSLAGKAFSDGFEIAEDEGFQARLLAFLNETRPLASCRHCVGTVGRKRPHALVGRRQWLDDAQRGAEEMVDYALLERSLQAFEHRDDCRVVYKPRRGLIGAIRSVFAASGLGFRRSSK